MVSWGARRRGAWRAISLYHGWGARSRRMDRITSMTTFTTVVASGSFTAAAQRLNMSPAMVTNHVRALEERLGARLLNRTTRKLSLTEAGKAYFDQAALILAQVEAADSSIAELQSTPRGTL